jgi:hypothetical protein
VQILEKLGFLFVASSFLTGCISGIQNNTVKAQKIFKGDSENSLIYSMGQPQSVETLGNQKVLKYCKTGLFSDDMTYIWIVDSRVRQYRSDNNKEKGSCEDFLRSVDWESTNKSGYLALNPAPRNYRTGRRDNSFAQAIAEGLKSASEKNNRMYNNLISPKSPENPMGFTSGYKTGEHTSGLNKYCRYSDGYVLTVNLTEICPLSH